MGHRSAALLVYVERTIRAGRFSVDEHSEWHIRSGPNRADTLSQHISPARLRGTGTACWPSGKLEETMSETKSTKNSGQNWTDADVDQLRELAEGNTPPA